jgi:peptidoglycan/LPS O-acetylase OafA/YrhL
MGAATSNPIAKKIVVPEIDGLRGVAIIAVVLHHLFSQPLTALHLRPLGIPLNPLFGNGWLGVNLFFILSGFVLYLPYAAGQRAIASQRDWTSFYKHRALRLLPAYYLATIAMMGLSGRAPFGDWAAGLQTIGLLTFTFPFIPSVFPPSVNWALWSIGTEVLFSAAFPLLCIACLRYGAFRILAVFIPLSIAIRFFAHSVDPRHITWLADGLMIGRVDEFLWGFWIAELFAHRRLPKHPYVMLVVAFIVLAPILMAFTWVGEHRLPFTAEAWLTTGLDVGFALIIGAAVATSSALSTVLTIKPLRVLGMACYSLYLWHYPILISLRLHVDLWNAPNLLAFGIMLFSVAALSYRFVEFRNVTDWRSLFLLGGRMRLRSNTSIEPPARVEPPVSDEIQRVP